MGIKKNRIYCHYHCTRPGSKKFEASPIQVIKILMSNGVMANINQTRRFRDRCCRRIGNGFEANQEAPEPALEEKEAGEIPLWRRLNRQ